MNEPTDRHINKNKKFKFQLITHIQLYSAPQGVKVSKTQKKTIGYLMGASHLVEATEKRGRCAQCGEGRVTTRCETCNLYFHVRTDKNCFSVYHHQQEMRPQVIIERKYLMTIYSCAYSG